MGELEPKVYQEILLLTKEGDALAEEEKYAAAIALYWEAFNLIPAPKTDWEASTWVLVAIGDANFLAGDFQLGVDNLSRAMHCPDAIGNGFIHLRLGQCQFEIENYKRAADELVRAYGTEGKEIFEGDDPKYLEFLNSKI